MKHFEYDRFQGILTEEGKDPAMEYYKTFFTPENKAETMGKRLGIISKLEEAYGSYGVSIMPENREVILTEDAIDKVIEFLCETAEIVANKDNLPKPESIPYESTL
jgi:hypothetical protein|tara:strand:- start:205 stop:522 length:318 start_codon:yes stop_codon:yes gene_type:complete